MLILNNYLILTVTLTARISQTKRCQHLAQHMVTFTGAGFTCFVSILDKKLASAIHRSETFNFDSLASAVQLQETLLTAHLCLGPIPKVEGLCMIQLDLSYFKRAPVQL